MTSDSPIHIDEDYKAQVEREKAAATQPAAGQPGSAQSAESPTAHHHQLPPPNLSTLLISLYSQAMLAMGLIPHPETGEASVRLDEAKHLIDTLGMLEEKTHGNRTPDEIRLLSRLLHEVRLTYMEVEKQHPA
jgi:hypothetical protein